MLPLESLIASLLAGLQKHLTLQGMKELYIKLYQPLPEGVQIKQRFWLSLAKKEYFHTTDRKVKYEKED